MKKVCCHLKICKIVGSFWGQVSVTRIRFLGTRVLAFYERLNRLRGFGRFRLRSVNQLVKFGQRDPCCLSGTFDVVTSDLV